MRYSASLAGDGRNCNLHFDESAQNSISKKGENALSALNAALGFSNHNKSQDYGNVRMTEPTPTNPSPIAVPWTPEMMNPQAASPTQPSYQPLQDQPYQTQNHPQPQPYAPPQIAPNSAFAQAAPAPQMPQAHAPHPQYQSEPRPAPIQPSAYMPPGQQPQLTSSPSPQMQQPLRAQLAHAQPAPAHYNQAPLIQPSPSTQFPQAGPPPVAPHMHVPSMDSPTGAEAGSKSLFAKLLKRSPKTTQLEPGQPTPSGQSNSLFNKNFGLGAVTGLVIGAFVLPMALGLFGGKPTVQPEVNLAPAPFVEDTSTAANADTFIDNVIAADAP